MLGLHIGIAAKRVLKETARAKKAGFFRLLLLYSGLSCVIVPFEIAQVRVTIMR